MKKIHVDSHLLSLRYSESISSVCSKINFILKVLRATDPSKNMKVNLTALLLISLVQHESRIASLTGIFTSTNTQREPSSNVHNAAVPAVGLPQFKAGSYLFLTEMHTGSTQP